MDPQKKERLEAKGFCVGSIAEFLELTPEQELMVLNVIKSHGKPIGVCECLGKGKEKCKGNGWVKDGSGFQKCPYFESWD